MPLFSANNRELKSRFLIRSKEFIDSMVTKHLEALISGEV